METMKKGIVKASTSVEDNYVCRSGGGREFLCVLCCYSHSPSLLPYETSSQLRTSDGVNFTTGKAEENQTISQKVGPLKPDREIPNYFVRLCENIVSKKDVPLEKLFSVLESTDNFKLGCYNNFSLCPECLFLVKNWMNSKDKMDSVEGHVRSLQLEILQDLRKLEGLFTKYERETKRIVKVLQCGDVSCLRSRLHQRKLNNNKEACIQNDNLMTEHDLLAYVYDDSEFGLVGELSERIFLFREGVLAVASDNVGVRNLSSDLPQRQKVFVRQDVFSNETRTTETQFGTELEGKNKADLAMNVKYHCEDTPNADKSVPILVSMPSNRGRGRPKKLKTKTSMDKLGFNSTIKRSRGRPKKGVNNNNDASDTVTAKHKQEQSETGTSGNRVASGRKAYRSVYGWETTQKKDLTFNCAICPNFSVSGTSKDLLFEQHLRQHETEEKHFSCEMCSLSFTHHQFFEFHRLSHHGLYNITCDVCNKQVKAFDIVSHIGTHEKVEKVMQCPNCSFACSQRKIYINHLGRHRVAKSQSTTIFDCDICLYRYKRWRDLTEHYMDVHHDHLEKIIIKCDKLGCSKTFLAPRQLYHHKLRVHTDRFHHPCTECGKILKSELAYSIHRRMHTGEKPYACTQCPERFKLSVSLDRHYRRDHGHATETHKCDQCEKEFLNLCYFKKHLKMHESNGFTCEQCGKVLFNAAGLQSHLRSHIEEKQWTCEACGKSFKQQNYLRIHKLKHTGVKNFKCTYCEKSFYRKEFLTCHTRTHTGERPYVCDVCGKDFNQTAALMVHKKNQHKKTEPNS